MAIAAAALSLSFATPTVAATGDPVYLYSATLTDSAAFGSHEGNQDFEAFGMAPLVVNAREGVGPGADNNFSFLAFCVDFSTPMPMDNYDEDTGANTLDRQYQEAAYVTLADATPANQSRVFELINFGSDLYRWHQNDALLNLKLQAVQGAIWQVMMGGEIVFSPYGSIQNPGYAPGKIIYDHYIQEYAAGDFGRPHVSSREIRTLVDPSTSGHAQSIAYAIHTAVPEPAAWALMIGGFFGAGMALRSSRRRALSAPL